MKNMRVWFFNLCPGSIFKLSSDCWYVAGGDMHPSPRLRHADYRAALAIAGGSQEVTVPSVAAGRVKQREDGSIKVIFIGLRFGVGVFFEGVGGVCYF